MKGSTRALVAVVIGGAVLAACTSASTSTSTPAARSTGSTAGRGPSRTSSTPLTASITALTKAGSARVSMDVTVSGPGTGTTFSEHGSGAFDFAKRRGSMTVRIAGMAAGGSAATPTLEVVLDRSVIYEKLPPGLLGEQAPKPWIKLDLSKSAAGSLLQGSPSASDPSDALALVQATGPTTLVGHDDVRGVPCDHYRATVDLARLSSSLPADARAALRSYEQTFQTTTFPIDAWVDAAGRLRKMSFSATLTPSSAGSSSSSPASLSETVEYFDFGAPVRISVPLASEVTDLSGLLGTPPP